MRKISPPFFDAGFFISFGISSFLVLVLGLSKGEILVVYLVVGGMYATRAFIHDMFFD